MNTSETIHFSDDDYLKRIGVVMKVILNMLLPVGFILFYVNYFLLDKINVAIIMLLLPAITIIGHILIKRGYLKHSLTLLIIAISLIATIANGLGNGIHETGIIAYPIMVIVSSLVLEKRGVVLTTLFVIACVAVLIFGEQFGYIENKPFPESRKADVYAVWIILISFLIILKQISGVSRTALKQSKMEITKQIKIANQLKTNLELKEELSREVHHRVKNNLSFLSSVIGFEMMKHEEKEPFKAMQARIQTIARAHDPLFQSEKYKKVNIKSYFERLIVSAMQEPDLITLDVSSEIQELHFGHSMALSFGIILNELLNITANHQLKLQISIYKEDECFVLLFSFNKEINLHPDSMEYLIIVQLAKQLKTQLLMNEKEISFKMSA